MSAMTPKERDKAMNIALFQMSSKMNTMIKDALGMPPSPLPTPPATPRKPAAQKPPSKIFTIEEVGHPPSDQGGHYATVPEQEEENLQLELVTVSEYDDDDVGAISLRDSVNEDYYVDDSQQEVCTPQGKSSARQCLSLPKEVHSNNELSVRKDSLKTYTREDYQQFARKKVRPQSAKPTQTRPHSAKVVVSNKSRPHSAKVTPATQESSKMAISRTRPQSATSTIQKIERPQSAKVAISNSHRPQSAKVTMSTSDNPKVILAKVTRPQSACGAVSRRPSSAKALSTSTDKVLPRGALPPKPPPKDATPSQRGHHHTRTTSGSVCVRSSHEQLPFRLRASPGGGSVGGPSEAGKPPMVKLQVTANVRPSSGRQPFTLVGSKAPQSRPKQATSRPTSAKKGRSP